MAYTLRHVLHKMRHVNPYHSHLCKTSLNFDFNILRYVLHKMRHEVISGQVILWYGSFYLKHVLNISRHLFSKMRPEIL